MTRSSIILVGPARAGKTTLANQLARDLNRPRQSLDDRRWGYYREVGFDADDSAPLERAGRLNERRRQLWPGPGPAELTARCPVGSGMSEATNPTGQAPPVATLQETIQLETGSEN